MSGKCVWLVAAGRMLTKLITCGAGSAACDGCGNAGRSRTNQFVARR